MWCVVCGVCMYVELWELSFVLNNLCLSAIIFHIYVFYEVTDVEVKTINVLCIKR